MSSPDADGPRNPWQALVRWMLERACVPLPACLACRCIGIAWDTWPERWDAAVAYRSRHGIALSDERMQVALSRACGKVRP